MPISITLSIYLARQYLASTFMVLAIFVSLAFIFDLVELMRQVSGLNNLGIGLLVSMTLFKLPTLIIQMAPYTVLGGAMWTFLRLTRSNELIVARAAGVSAWQFLTPILIVTILIGFVMVLILNPVAASMLARYQQLDATYLSGRPNLLAVSESGIWLREAAQTGQTVIHAVRLGEEGRELREVTVFRYAGNDKFSQRIDAAEASLGDGQWLMKKAWITGRGQPPDFHDQLSLKTTLTTGQIQDSFAPPETMSVLELPQFIDVLEQAGFTATRHRLHFQSVLATPLLFSAMVLVAAGFSLRITRQGGLAIMVSGGFLTAFMLFFLSNIAVTMGTSGNLPVVMAAWAPASISVLLGMAILFNSEDG
jgi:lipopolysaccharide export system permease protein